MLDARHKCDHPMMNIQTIILEGNAVRLEPIRREQWKPLWEVAKDAAEEIFRWIPYPMRTSDDFAKWLENRRKACRGGQAAQIMFESMPAMN
jgi:hypothetical protein